MRNCCTAYIYHRDNLTRVLYYELLHLTTTSGKGFVSARTESRWNHVNKPYIAVNISNLPPPPLIDRPSTTLPTIFLELCRTALGPSPSPRGYQTPLAAVAWREGINTHIFLRCCDWKWAMFPGIFQLELYVPNRTLPRQATTSVIFIPSSLSPGCLLSLLVHSNSAPATRGHMNDTQ